MSPNPRRATSQPHLVDVSRRPRLVVPLPSTAESAAFDPVRRLAAAGPTGRMETLGRVDPAARAGLVAQMQRTHGNTHVQRFLAASRPPVPARVRIQRCGATPCGCSTEERVAHTVQEAPATPEAAETLQRLASFDLAGAIQRSAAGEPLHPIARARLEPAMGLDLGHVVVHRDREADKLARAVDAEAFTSGDHVFFREGRYDPQSSSGLRLLAHEVTHTVQQSRGAVTGVQGFGGVLVSEPGDSHEQEAERAADTAIARLAAPPSRSDPEAVEGSRPAPIRRHASGSRGRSASGPTVIQRSFQQDTAPGFSAKWTPFASVNAPPFFQKTNFDTDGFHDEFNVPPKSSGRLIILADVEWTKGGGGPNPNPVPKPDVPSEACKILIAITKPVPLLNQAITLACNTKDPAAVIDSINDAQLCILAGLLGVGVGAAVCAVMIAVGAGETVRNLIKDILGIPRTKPGPNPNPGPNPGPNPAATGKGRATIETRFFVGVDGKITTVGLPPRIEANGTGAELVSPVDFLRSDIPGGVNVAFQPMLKGTTPGETHVFQHQWDIDLKQPAPPAPLPFTFGVRLFPFVTGKDVFEDEGTQQGKLLTWFQTMDPRVRSRIIASQIPVIVHGFASRRGNPTFNLTLSEKRAKRVKQMVSDFGGAFANVNTFAFGALLSGTDPSDNSGFFRRADVRACGQLEGADAAGGAMQDPAGNDPTVCPGPPVPVPATLPGGDAAAPDTSGV